MSIHNVKVFVTGASGFLGEATVKAFSKKGHCVRALVRSSQSRTIFADDENVEVVVGDLRRASKLIDSIKEVDAVVHLAAGTSGTIDEQLPPSVVATEKLLETMLEAGVKRLILASTLSVYDWTFGPSTILEDSPLEKRLYQRDGYAIAKTWQERVVFDAVKKHGLELTVIRPGFIWGKGREWVPGAGMRAGRIILVNGPLRRLPITHVVNCADCFVAATENPLGIGEIFNLVDPDHVTAGKFARDYVRHFEKRGIRLRFPYLGGLLSAHLATLFGRLFFGKHCKLPGTLMPIRYRARFKSVHVPISKLQRVLGWRCPFSYKECLRMTYFETTHKVDCY
jgi:nucleoside-diphosphate-sugar epimerase